MHFGVILPNYGAGSSPDGIRRLAEAAEELGFDSVWTTEHIIVGPEAVDPYGRVYDPLVTLGWIAGQTERVGLGTSIVLVPLHNPMHLAKEVTTLQELSGGRFTLGVGMGWHKDEFEFMGVEFRSAVADFSAASSELPGSLQANVYRSVGRLPAAASRAGRRRGTRRRARRLGVL